MIFDILFLAFVGLGFWWGYKKGIVYSLFSLAGWFLGIVMALKFSYFATKFLKNLFDLGPQAMAIASFICVFVIVLGFMRLLAYILEEILKSFSLNLVNQLIGGAIYMFISVYVFAVLIWFTGKMDIISASQKKSSHTYAFVESLGPQVIYYTSGIVPAFRNAFNQFEELYKKK
jgi:membrane protein required for colicin V production